jgi:hypothetical protein
MMIKNFKYSQTDCKEDGRDPQDSVCNFNHLCMDAVSEKMTVCPTVGCRSVNDSAFYECRL